MKNKHTLFPCLKEVIRNYLFLALALLVLILGAAVVAVLPPLALQGLIDHLSAGQDTIFLYAISYTALSILGCGLNLGREICIAVFGQKVTHSLRSAMSRKMTRMQASFFINEDPGEVSSVFYNDIRTVENLFTSGVISMFSDLVQLISILIVVITISKGLFVILLITLPLLFALTRVFQKRMLVLQKMGRAAAGKASAQIPESLHNLLILRLFHGIGWARKRYAKAIDEGYAAGMKAALYDSIYSPIILLTASVVIAVMMSLSARGGAALSLFGMSAGTAVAMIAYVSRIFTPLESIGMEIQNIQTASAGLSRLDTFMGQPERDLIKEGSSATADPPIQVHHITFGYRKDQPLIRDFSMTLDQGEFVTIAGRTGCGKTTLLRLLLGLYTPDSGEILLGGRKADQIADLDKRRLYGCVEQKVQILPGTVGDQITLKNQEITDDMALKALGTVGLEDAVEALPKRLHTPFAETSFSNGQRQLLGIARAIAGNPKILFLDEVTADLDSDTEERILLALQKASSDRTVVSVSHRLSAREKGRVIRLGE